MLSRPALLLRVHALRCAAALAQVALAPLSLESRFPTSKVNASAAHSVSESCGAQRGCLCEVGVGIGAGIGAAGVGAAGIGAAICSGGAGCAAGGAASLCAGPGCCAGV